MANESLAHGVMEGIPLAVLPLKSAAQHRRKTAKGEVGLVARGLLGTKHHDQMGFLFRTYPLT
jgi:hypothetical protein